MFEVKKNKTTQFALSEVTSQPVIVNFKETDVTNEKGTRLVSITWKVIFLQKHLLRTCY